jgi:predicted HTH domain antitoxin
MKLITEQIEDIEILTEESDGKKDTFIKGIFLQTEITNRNGRMYKYATMEREVNKYNEEFVKRGRALGELGHPDGPTINLDRVSHKIVELYPEGTNFIGKAKLLETPMGKIAKNLLEEGVQLGVSSRGLGSIKREGTSSVVADDFILATAADIVADPSAPDAFVEGIYEGKEWVMEGNRLKEVHIEQIKQALDTAPSREELMERKIRAFDYFLRNL